MRIAIFSDIHGNDVALRAVLKHYESLDIDRYVCLGDVVGYGPAPDECCNIVRALVEVCVMGNHDAAVSGEMDYAFYYDEARRALDHHAHLVSEENRAWLRSLPYTSTWEDVCYSHGSPIQPENFNYVFNFHHAAALLPHYDELSHVTFIGHSHLTTAYSLGGPDEETRIEALEGPRLEFDPARKYIVTVGSVGQPRDNDARACCTVYDSNEKTLDYHRIDYDVCSVADAIFRDKNLSIDFGKRLLLGT